MKLVCLDDDDQGRQLEVLWELELGARVDSRNPHGLGAIAGLDPPRRFAAYLHAAQVERGHRDGRAALPGAVPRGHQADGPPARRRSRRRSSFPARTCSSPTTWASERPSRPGSCCRSCCSASASTSCSSSAPRRSASSGATRWSGASASASRSTTARFVARRRQERGFGVNPWTTHNALHHLVPDAAPARVPRPALLQHLGNRAQKSLLILDEAHTAAPASASKYAVDSRVTRVIRDVAPRFENRLFLSATPHNGHSNSFSALLEILDPQRFTRGVPVTGHEGARGRHGPAAEGGPPGARQASGFPERKVVPDRPRPRERRSSSSCPGSSPSTRELVKPEKGKGELVFINLQKRLLSQLRGVRPDPRASTPRAVGRAVPAARPQRSRFLGEDDDEYGIDDDAEEQDAAHRSSVCSSALPRPEDRARALLERCFRTSRLSTGALPTRRSWRFVDWIRADTSARPSISAAPAAGVESSRGRTAASSSSPSTATPRRYLVAAPRDRGRRNGPGATSASSSSTAACPTSSARRYSAPSTARPTSTRCASSSRPTPRARA